MDYVEQYDGIAQKINALLPLKAYPVRELVKVFRDKGTPITLKT